MAKTSGKKSQKVELPGVPLGHFEAGVRALVELRDMGKFLVFLACARSAQLVGRRTEFSEGMSKELDGAELEPKESRAVLDEIRQFLSARVRMRTAEQVADIFIRSVGLVD